MSEGGAEPRRVPPTVVELQAIVSERAPIEVTALAAELRARRIPLTEDRVRAMIERFPELFASDSLGRVVAATHDRSQEAPSVTHADRVTDWWRVPAGADPIDPERVIVLDIETTGLDRRADHVTELAIADLDGRILWSRTLEPGSVETAEALRVLHTHLAAAEAVAGHNLTRFDLPFLEAVAQRAGLEWQSPPCPLDVHALSLLVAPTLEGRTLDSLCDVAGISNRAPHTAIGDAEATAGVARWLLGQVDTTLDSWGLALRLLAESGDGGWPRLLPAPVIPGTLSEAIAARPDPLARPQAVVRPRVPVRKAVIEAFDRYAGSIEGYVDRPAQVEMASAVGDVLDSGGHLLVEAPTGTGKSLAYLVPAAWRAESKGTPVVIATHTKVLQRQLRGDAQALRDVGLLNAPFRQIQGVSNYLCPRNIAETIEAGGEGTNWFALAVAVRALAETPNGVWDDVTDGLPARSDLNYRRQRAMLRATAGTCERWACAFVEQCPLYERLAGIDQHAGIVATNHALMAVWAKQAQGHEIPGQLFGARPTALIIDEAHTLEDSLTSAWAEGVGAINLAVLRAGVYGRNGLIRQLRPLVAAGALTSEAAQELSALDVDLRQALDDLGAAVAAYLHDFGGTGQSTELRPTLVRGRPLFQDVARTVVRAAALLGVLQARLIDARPEGADPRCAAVRRRIDGLIEDAGDHASALGLLRELPASHAFVHRLGGPNLNDGGSASDEWTFERLPIEIGPLYREYIASASDAIVLTSATLRVSDRFDFIGTRLGLLVESDGTTGGTTDPDPVVATGMAVESPFDHDEQSAVVLMSHLPLPVPVSQDQFCEELGADQVGFLSLSGGRTLGLFAARARMHEVASVVHEHGIALRGRGVELLVQGDDSPGRIQQRFKANPGTTVYGVRSYWEGFDAPGDTLSYLLIEKPPYPHPNDELKRARQRVIQERGGDSFMDYVVPLTSIAMTQGFGRLIRRETDRGVALIADRRMLQPSAANGVFLESLPTSNIHYADDRDDAWRFAIEFVTGEEPDLASALLVSTNKVDDLLASLRLVPGEDPEAKLRLAALELFGIENLRVEQMDIMKALLEGRDVVGFLPTGSGKSLTFQLPALLHPRALPTVVVSPLVALIKDQVDELRSRRGIRVVAGITGRTSAAERTETMRDMANGKIRLLYIAPERLVRDPTLRQSIARQDLGALVVDEAHCVSSWGHDFRPEFRQITTAVRDFRRSPRLGLTATATREVEADIIVTLDLDDPLVVRRPVDRPDLSYWVRSVARDADRTRELLRIAAHMGDQPGIVYASRRALTEELAWVLREAGLSARAYHGGMVPEQRDAVQDDYLAGVTQIIVATKAFGMGVNKADIGWVVHYDLPESLEAYAQEAGRAARSPDIHGLCVLFFTKQDLTRRRRHIGREGASEDLDRARRLLDLIETYPSRGTDRLVDADEVAEALEMETDELNVMVAWLERAGALERLQDCSWRVRISAGHREPSDQAERGAFVRLVKQQLKCRVGTSRLVVIGDAAAEAGMDPDQLENQLIDWSLQRLVTFQTTQRRWRLRKLGPLDAAKLRAVVERWHEIEGRRLTEMIRYATGDGCRRSAILRAFGDDHAGGCDGAVDPCDVHGDTAPPWHEVPLTAILDPEELVDVELVLLQAVRWANGFKGGSYGEAGLKAAILGRETLGEGRPLSAGLMSCPFFGALRYLRAADRRLEQATVELVNVGLIERTDAEHAGHAYRTLRLTPAGRAHLEGRT